MKDRRSAMRAAVVGCVGVVLAAAVTGVLAWFAGYQQASVAADRQHVQSREEFLRDQKKDIYAGLLTKISGLDAALTALDAALDEAPRGVSAASQQQKDLMGAIRDFEGSIYGAQLYATTGAGARVIDDAKKLTNEFYSVAMGLVRTHMTQPGDEPGIYFDSAPYVEEIYPTYPGGAKSPDISTLKKMLVDDCASDIDPNSGS